MKRTLLAFSFASVFQLSLASLGSAFAQDPYSVLQGVDGGDPKLEVENAGFARSLTRGDEINPGDSMSSGKGQRLTLTLSNRFVLILDENTAVQFGKTSQVSHAIRLQRGRLRVLGRKSEGTDEGARRRAFRLVIKTKQAVVGVRGTELQVTSADVATQVFVVDGAVEVAKTENVLFSGQGTSVAAGFQVQVDKGGISSPTTGQGAELPVQGVNLDQFFAVGGDVPPVENDDPSPPIDSSKGYAGKNNPAPAQEFTGATRMNAFQAYWQRAYFRQATPEIQYNGFGLSWNPTVSVMPDSLELRGWISFFYGKPDLPVTSVYGIDLKFLASLQFLSPILVELGPTLQVWSGQGTQGGLSMNLGARFGSPLVGIIDRVFVGGDLLLASVRTGSTNTSNSYCLRAGLGFSF
ncbi:MAG: FecR domain-containing protein [Bacteriovoracia bacterium]